MTDKKTQTISQHFHETIKLSAPIIVARSAIILVFVIDTVMTGWHSAAGLAEIGLGTTALVGFLMMGIGALQAVMILVAQAGGAGRTKSFGEIWRAGCVLGLWFGCVIAILSLFGKPIFLLLGQPAEIIEGAANATFHFGWGVPGMFLFAATNYYLEASGRPKAGMVIMVTIVLANIPLNGLFVLGWLDLFESGGAVAATATSSALRWLAFVLAAGYAIYIARKHGDPHALLVSPLTLLKEFYTFGGEMGRTIMRIGIPLGLMQSIESIAFTGMVFFAGRMGQDILAAHQLTMTLITLIYMIAIGVAGAASIRVGNAFGAGAFQNLQMAGWCAIITSGILTLPFVFTFLFFPSALAGLMVNEPVVVEIAKLNLATCAFLITLDAMMAVTLGSLRGMSMVWKPLGIHTLAFIGVALPLAFLFTEVLHIGPTGLFWALIGGVTVSFSLLALLFQGTTSGYSIRQTTADQAI